MYLDNSKLSALNDNVLTVKVAMWTKEFWNGILGLLYRGHTKKHNLPCQGGNDKDQWVCVWKYCMTDKKQHEIRLDLQIAH